jgi:hypothetical protein
VQRWEPTSEHQATKIRAGEVEGVAELDQHVERAEQTEQILAPLVVDQ